MEIISAMFRIKINAKKNNAFVDQYVKTTNIFVTAMASH